MMSGLSSHSTPLRIGRLSSFDTANAVCEISFCSSPDLIRQLESNLTVGKFGNSSRGSPRILKCDRPQSSVTRCSPDVATFTGEGGSSLAISESFLAGIVIAPCVSTSAATSVVTAMSRSVPDNRMPRSVVSTRMFASTGSVVFGGVVGVTAASPSCNFSREMVNRIADPQNRDSTALQSLCIYQSSSTSRACGKVWKGDLTFTTSGPYDPPLLRGSTWIKATLPTLSKMRHAVHTSSVERAHGIVGGMLSRSSLFVHRPSSKRRTNNEKR